MICFALWISLPRTLNPPKTLTDCGVSPRWPMTGICRFHNGLNLGGDVPPPFELDRLRIALLHKPARVCNRLFHGHVIT